MSNPPIRKPAPPLAQRPLCVGCGHPLRPDYVEVFADTDELRDWKPNPDARPLVRDWRGWQGFGTTKADPTPTHCGPTCASYHGARLAHLLLDSLRDDDRGAIVLTDDGRRRFTINRPDPRHVNAARDVLATDPNERT